MTTIENTAIRPVRRIHLVKIFVMDQPVIDKVIMTSLRRQRIRKLAVDPDVRELRREGARCPDRQKRDIPVTT